MVMSIYHGTNRITRVFFGTAQVKKIFLGTQQVWAPPNPPPGVIVYPSMAQTVFYTMEYDFNMYELNVQYTVDPSQININTTFSLYIDGVQLHKLALVAGSATQVHGGGGHIPESIQPTTGKTWRWYLNNINPISVSLARGRLAKDSWT